MQLKRLSLFLLVTFWIVLTNFSSAEEDPPQSFEKALELIHAFSGAGDELQRAVEIADALSRSHPNKGYSQALQAEMLSTWELDQRGKPQALLAHIIDLTDQALRLNPSLGQAHVARARALLRASRYDEASAAIDAGLKLNPNLTGAFFLRAEILRRDLRVADAETWYLKFIDHTTSPTRRSNAYYWLAKLYQDAARVQPREWATLISKARRAYETMLELDPNGAWKNVNFAIFLNNEAGDFLAAERYAQKALSIMDFPMARYHLAIARYQKLLAPMVNMNDSALKGAVAEVFQSTGVSLEDAITFSKGYFAIPGRLHRIRDRLSRATK